MATPPYSSRPSGENTPMSYAAPSSIIAAQRSNHSRAS
ncbi:hypothetical protein EPAKOI_000114 [Cupriavidus sp. H18C2]